MYGRFMFDIPFRMSDARKRKIAARAVELMLKDHTLSGAVAMVRHLNAIVLYIDQILVDKMDAASAIFPKPKE